MDLILYLITASDSSLKKNSFVHKPFESYEKDIDEILKFSSNDAMYWYSKGIMLKADLYFKEALEAFNKAIYLRPHDISLTVMALYNKGVVLEQLQIIEEEIQLQRFEKNGQLQRFEEALEAYDKATMLNVNDITLSAIMWFKKGSLLYRIYLYERMLKKKCIIDSKSYNYTKEALKAFDKAIVLKPDFADAWYKKANTLKKLVNYEEALEAYDKAIMLKPYYAIFTSLSIYAFENKGDLLSKFKRYEEAIDAYDKSLEVIDIDHPFTGSIWYKKITPLIESERYEEALEICEKVISLRGDRYYTYPFLARLKKGYISEKLKRYEEALEIYDKAIAYGGDDKWRGWCEKGLLFKKLGRYIEALKAFDKALEQDSIFNLHKVWYEKACIYALKGYKKITLINLSKAIELNDKLKEEAKKDEDFQNLWADEDFRKIIGEVYDKSNKVMESYLHFYDNSYALYEESVIFKDFGFYKEALEKLDKAIDKEKNKLPEAWYEKACIYALEANKKDTLINLSKAIDLDVKYKEKAKKDEDLKNLWDHKDFKSITRYSAFFANLFTLLINKKR